MYRYCKKNNIIYLHKPLGYITIYKDSKEKQRHEYNAVEIETCAFS